MRLIRSYARRQCRISPHQARAYIHLLPHYGLTLEAGLLDLTQVFQKPAPVTLEIGFGMGQSLVQQAIQNPTQNYLGIEVYRPGVGAILNQIAQLQLTNLKIFCADAIEVLQRCLSSASLSQIQIFFPDPWPKTRHHKRRLIQSAFIDLLREKLVLGGQLYIATDWQDYALQALRVLEAAAGWENKAGRYQFAKRPCERPMTKFETRGKDLGHTIWDLIFVRVPTTDSSD